MDRLQGVSPGPPDALRPPPSTLPHTFRFRPAHGLSPAPPTRTGGRYLHSTREKRGELPGGGVPIRGGAGPSGGVAGLPWKDRRPI